MNATPTEDHAMTQSSELLALADAIYPILRDFPADGQLRSDTQHDKLSDLLLAGYVEREEVEKPCKTCGKLRFDYGYFRITGGGKLFMAAYEARTLATKDERHASRK